MTRPWMLDEMAYAGPEHLDPGFVARFDEKQGRPDPTEDLDLLEAAGVTGTVVDFGAGTGQFSLAAAKRFERVVAVDVSPVMVDMLRERAAAQGLDNVEVVRAGFLGYEHAGPPADAVYTRHALHQIPDFWKAMALRRMAGFLRAHGVLRIRDLIYDFGPEDAEDVFEQWMAGAATDPTRGYTAEDYAEHVRTEHSTFRWLFEPIVEAAGFEIVAVHYRAAAFGAYTCRLR